MSDGNGKFTILSHVKWASKPLPLSLTPGPPESSPPFHIHYQIIVILYEPFVPLFMLFNPITDLFSDLSIFAGGTMNLI